MMYLKEKSGGVYPITDEQARKIIEIKNTRTNGMVEINGSFLDLNSIAGIYTGEMAETLRISSMGVWQCKFGYYHTKYQGCRDTIERNVNGMDYDELAEYPIIEKVESVERIDKTGADLSEPRSGQMLKSTEILKKFL